MIRGRGVFYANDKSLNDALTQKKIKNSDIAELFISRGILISRETDRDEAAKYFCRLNHDYFDHQKIANVLGVTKRREKSTFVRIESKLDEEKIEKVLNNLKGEIEGLGDTAEIVKSQLGLQLKIKYQSVNYGKTEFSQVAENQATISLERENGTLILRTPNTDYSKDVKERVLDELEKAIEGKLDFSKISISAHLDADKKSKFFIDLAKGIKGFDFDDITDVFVFNPEKNNYKEGEGNTEDSQLGVHIEKASMKGKGILNSKLYADLKNKGFYISKIIWKIKSKSKDKIVELEAQFSAPSSCSDFAYQVRGEYLSNNYGVFNKTRRAVSKSEDIRLQRLIEESAYNSINQLSTQ